MSECDMSECDGEDKLRVDDEYQSDDLSRLIQLMVNLNKVCSVFMTLLDLIKDHKKVV